MSGSNTTRAATPQGPPLGWAACTLAEATVPGRNRGNPADFAGQPFVGLEHVEAHTTRLLGYVPAETMRSSGVRFTEGDVLYARMRPYLNKVWLADRDGLCSGEFIVFPGDRAMRGGFLKYRLNAQDFVRFSDRATTGDRPRADFADFGKFPVLVPPLAEQERIADRIDELFTDLSAGVAALERVKRNLSRYRAAVLHAAVTGRLTEAWRKEHGPAEEPGPKLLERILAERWRLWEERTLAKYEKDGKKPPKTWRSRYSEPPRPHSWAADDLPVEWLLTSLGTCFEVRTGGTPSRNRPDYWSGGIPWVSSGEVSFCRIKETAETISETGVMNSNAKIRQPGTVLLGMIGEGKTRGQVAILDVAAANNQNAAAILVSETSVLPEYVYLWLWSQYDETRRAASGGNQPALNADRVGRIRLPLPPVAEQAAIVEAVNEKLSQIDALEAEVERGLKRAGRLRQAILKAAFEGKLVPQDPNDEPASALLERIRTGAASTNRTSPRTRRRRSSRKAASK